MHLLEMAKTAWNAIVSGTNDSDTDGFVGRLEGELRVYISSCREILLIFGHEGDAGGPLEEIHTLYRLLENK